MEPHDNRPRPRPSRVPVTTYRLQLRAEFGFAAARELTGYLAEIGVTDCYSSPLLKAHPGSTHGYDICDHSRLNSDLGTPAEFDAWCDALGAAGLGLLLDIVPNHMACDPGCNPWWRDVLENGPGSPYAPYFDIDWSPVKPELNDRVLLPILGEQYGLVLERGELTLAFREGRLHLRYGAVDLPISPREAPRVLGLHEERLARALEGESALREYQSILTALRNLPAYTERDPARVAERQREKEVTRERLLRLVAEAPAIGSHIEQCVREVNGTPGDPASFDTLHALLEHQAYRLAYWRTAGDEINYRRFFDVNELAGLRTEVREVFDATHTLLARLIAARQVTGVRVDHPDGLYDPAEYFARLQALARNARAGGGSESGVPAGYAPEAPLYVVAEKILSPGEQVRSDWDVDGTTGYGFLNLVAGLFVDGRHLGQLRRVYGQVTGRQVSFEEVAHESKSTIMLTTMASELNVLAHALNRLAEQDRRRRDFTLNSCRKLLHAFVACLPVYRTYVSGRGPSAFDRASVESAIAEARRRNPLMEASIFTFLRETLLPFPEPSGSSQAEGSAETIHPRGEHDDRLQGDGAGDRLTFAMRLQQFTGPVHAKGVEDTAFYRYHVLISANDVGGRPARPDVSPAEFHEANARRLSVWPLELLTTATHDTKRGEDARVRIAALSEMPTEWRARVSDWMRLNGRHRRKVAGLWAPDRNDEYFFYQTLLGVWPAESGHAVVAERAGDELIDRLVAYLQKAVQEAKVHTSWIENDAAYTTAIVRFVTESLNGPMSARFLRSFVPFARRVARVGMIHSLAQLTLKLSSPGVSDVYQGAEFWDLSLVDPDNRRPVDFQRRRQALDQLRPVIECAEQGLTRRDCLDDLLSRWEDGRIKLFVMAAGLRVRRAHASMLLDGAYVPLVPEGPLADHVVAFARRHESGMLLTIVPRLVGTLWPAGEHADNLAWAQAPGWDETRVSLPESLASPGGWRHVLTGETVTADVDERGACLRPGNLFRHWPVAMLLAHAHT
jgi:(1->4)-alpha-D-glucan 1-alpha-D-glucosylmutase